MKIHEKIGKLRKEKNISQERLAEEIGVSRQSVTKWENAEALPEIDKLILLSGYFGVTIDSIVKDDEKCCRNGTSEELEKEKIIRFLCRAKRETYAGKGGEIEPSRINSHDLRHREGNLEYYDTYLGGERFSGEEAVWVDHHPVWAMNYTGRTLGELFSGDFLKEALSMVPFEMPFRGPAIHVKNEYGYHCHVNGTFEWFHGYEEIRVRNEKVYECLFHGGIIK
jgi:transcriptional regulator with XRE-family HTH domain